MCRGLRERGLEVLLATTDDDLPASNDTGEYKRGIVTDYQELPVIFFPKQLGASFKYSLPFGKWLDQNVSQYDVVHIHAVFNHACISAARACREKKVPYIVRPLGTLDPWGMKQKSLRKKVFWHAFIKKMIYSAAAIHYTAQGEREAVEESLKLNHGFIVPLGVEIKGSDGDAAPRNWTGNFPALRENPYVLVLSRLLPTKGLDALLEAFLSLMGDKEFAHWRLVFAGEGPADYVASLKRTVAQQLAADFVVFTGWLANEKEEVLRNAALLALPSHHENFGLSVLEALAAGVPVLISPQVNLAPDVEASGAGWIANIDKDSLETALAAALSSEAERRRRGEAGRNLALKFMWPVIAGKLCDVYQAVLDGQ